MRLDTQGNLGLGMTPSAWQSGRPALEIGGTTQATIAMNGNATNGGAIWVNSYFNGANPIYKANGIATILNIGGQAPLILTIAPTGTAGTAVPLTNAMTLDNAGNLGLGVTPSPWVLALYHAIEVGQLGNAIYGGPNQIFVSSNAYFNAGWKYAAAYPASNYCQNNGSHNWQIAAAGTAGAAIAFNQAMTLDTAGNLSIGTTSPTTIAGTGAINLNGTNGGFVQLYAGGAKMGHLFGNSSSVGLDTTAASTPLIFGISGTEQARIVSGGVMYLGGNSNGLLAIQNSAQLLYILGGTPGQITDCAQLVLTGTTFSTPKAAFLRANSTMFTNSTGGLEYARFNSAGEFMVGTTTAIASTPGRGNITIAGATDVLLGLNANGVQGYVWQSATALTINAGGSQVAFNVGGAAKLIATTTQLLDNINSQEIGWRDIPQTAVNQGMGTALRGYIIPINASPYTLLASGATNMTVCYVNLGSIAISLTGWAGLHLAGTTSTGNRVLAPFGFATVWYQSPTVAYIMGNVS